MYPCYTTKTGLKIGCAYQAPIRQMTHEEIRIQSVLLGCKPPRVSGGRVALICFAIWLAIVWVTK
jgi:hypothetical protein